MDIFSNEIMEESNHILYEFNEGMTKATSALYVSDIMIEQSINEGATNIEVLVESVIGDRIKQAIEWFKQLLQRIKDWFKKVTHNTEKECDRIEKDVKENINPNKNTNTYKELEAPTSIYDNIKNEKYKEAAKGKTYFLYTSQPYIVLEFIEGVIKNDYNHLDEIISDKDNKDKLGIGTSSELKDKTIKEYISKRIEKYKGTSDCSYASKDEINKAIKLCTSGKDFIKKINDTERVINKYINDIINTLNRDLQLTYERRNMDTDAKNNMAKDIQKTITYYQKRATEVQAAVSYVLQEQMTSIRESYKFLRCYMSKEGLKNNHNVNEPEGYKESYTSIFEAAYNMI